METPFKLSASLSGHTGDVRDVVFVNPSSIASASRDGSLRLWQLQDQTPPGFDGTIMTQGAAFLSSVAFVPPSQKYPDGLLVSGARDGMVELRSPKNKSETEADIVLVGHGNNVCALDVSQDGKHIISGAWDSTAMIWEVGKWEPNDAIVLQGHNAAVWGVLAFNDELVVTASADQHVRVFNYRGKLGFSFQASDDILRALCRVPSSYGSQAQIATAGNDKKIRLWTLQGKLVSELLGHEHFVYNLTSLSSGELVSCGEDRTVKIWKGTSCVQTIAHPAISVWCVASCPETGDIASGASDNTIRIFSRTPERQADEATLKLYDEAIQSSQIPQQSLGTGSRSDYPGPEFLQQKSGTKEGQTQVIKESNGRVYAYQWSMQGNSWVKVGEVVDSAGNSSKVNYNGKDYDYVFDVDIKEGAPPLKLPYNSTESPWQAAYDFLAANELPQTYLEEVANFITRNTQGTSLGTRPQGLGSSAEPWGTESRYRPGDGSQQTQTPAPRQVKKVLPQKDYLSIPTANHAMMLKKIKEFNQQLRSENDSSAFSPEEESAIEKAMKQITTARIKSTTTSMDATTLEATMRGATSWPIDKRLPCLDFLRLLTAVSPDTVKYFGSDSKSNLVARLVTAGTFDIGENGPPENNVMLSVRTLANLFTSKEGKELADEEFERAMDVVAPHAASENKNLCIALTTLYINYSVLLTSGSPEAAGKDGKEAPSTVDRVITLLDALSKVLMTSTDPEAIYRALVAMGTVMSLGKDYVDVAKESMDVDVAIERAEEIGGQERIREVVKEIKDGF